MTPPRYRADYFNDAWLADYFFTATEELNALVRPAMQARWSNFQAGHLAEEAMLSRHAVVRTTLQYAGQEADPEDGSAMIPALAKIWDTHFVFHPDGRVWANVQPDTRYPPYSKDGDPVQWEMTCFLEAEKLIGDLRTAGAFDLGRSVRPSGVLRLHAGFAFEDGVVIPATDGGLSLSDFCPVRMGGMGMGGLSVETPRI